MSVFVCTVQLSAEASQLSLLKSRFHLDERSTMESLAEMQYNAATGLYKAKWPVTPKYIQRQI